MSENVEYDDILSDWLRKIDFRAEVFFRDAYCGNWAVDTSGSNNVPFHLVSQGEGWLHSDGIEPQRLLPGSLVFFPQDQSHVLSASPEHPNKKSLSQAIDKPEHETTTRLVCGYFLLDRQLASPLLSGMPSALVLNLAASPSSSARELINLLMREAAEKRLGSDVAVDRLAELVFIEVLRSEAQNNRLTGLFSVLGDPRIEPVLAAIHKNPGDNHRLKDMADASNLSESAFAQRFKKVVGMTPGQYIRHWRMQIAARALRDTQRSMSDIATSIGYESEIAFRKAFRSYFDKSPGAYRSSSKH